MVKDRESTRKELERFSDDVLLSIVHDKDGLQWYPEIIALAASILESRGVPPDKAVSADAGGPDKSNVVESVSDRPMAGRSRQRTWAGIPGLILRFTAAAFLVLIALLLAWSLAGHLIANRAERRLQDRWLQTAGWNPEDLYKNRPKTADVIRNGTARELEALADRLGIRFHGASLGPNFLKSQGRKWREIVMDSGISQGFLDYELSIPEDGIDELPEEISRYLSDHSKEIADLYHVLLSDKAPLGELPEEAAGILRDEKREFDDLYCVVWANQSEMSGNLLQGPFSLSRLIFLQRLIALDVLGKAQRGRQHEAMEGMYASWKIGEALREVPLSVSQAISGYCAYSNAKLIRKLRGIPEEWQARLVSHSYGRAALRVYATKDAVGRHLIDSSGLSKGLFSDRSWLFNGTMSSPVIKPYLRILACRNSAALAELVERLGGINLQYYGKVAIPKEYLDGKASWNILPVYLKSSFDPGLLDSWERGTVIDLYLEQAQKILKLKTARAAGLTEHAPEESSVCKGTNWMYEASADGSTSVHLSRVPDWIESMHVDLSYRIRPPSAAGTNDSSRRVGETDQPTERVTPPGPWDTLVTSRTDSLKIVSCVERSSDLLDLLIRNVSNKNAVMVSLSLNMGNTQAFRVARSALYDPVIPAGGVLFWKDASRSVSGDPVVISTVVFADGSFEGDGKTASRYLAKTDGVRIQATSILPMLKRTLAAGDSDLPGSIVQLENDLGRMREAIDREGANSILNARFKGFEKREIDQLYEEFKGGLYEIRRDVLDAVADARSMSQQSGGSESQRASRVRDRLTLVVEELEGITNSSPAYPFSAEPPGR